MVSVIAGTFIRLILIDKINPVPPKGLFVFLQFILIIHHSLEKSSIGKPKIYFWKISLQKNDDLVQQNDEIVKR